ncbi:hypothetical protein L6452_28475 [Arctium lappa]|uniref:Uncharacterized protein n=1 Tax=Arctium lappa TaxID=4217 RepID=A0ACB8ZYE1_ARCLA|nr:hypothetical protein L6452_28475 [Arctium lappa]
MASFSLSTIPTTTNKTNSHRLNPHHTKKTHRFKPSYNATKDGNNNNTLQNSKTLNLTQPKTSSHMHNINRRNFLLGLGGLSAAIAFPVQVESAGTVKDVEFPVKLNQTVKVLVKRPAVNKTKQDKENATEVLMVNGIRFDGEKFVKFNVFVNDKDNVPEITTADSEFAGHLRAKFERSLPLIFAQLPHSRSSEKMMMMSGARFGITELLEDLKDEDDEYVLVSLVPKMGCEDVTISEIRLNWFPMFEL